MRFWDGARWSVPVPAEVCPGDAADRTADVPPDPRGGDMIEWRDWRPEWLAWADSETNVLRGADTGSPVQALQKPS